MIPEGSPVAWFPTQMADFFKDKGIDRVSTRMSGETVDKELPKFRQIALGRGSSQGRICALCPSHCRPGKRRTVAGD